MSKRIRDDTTVMHTSFDGDFMAPEILGFIEDDSSDEYTEAVDIWSLGCIAYWLLTGRVPVRKREMLAFCNGRKSAQIRTESLQVGPSGIDFLLKLLKPLPCERISAKQARLHDWPRMPVDEHLLPESRPAEPMEGTISEADVTTKQYVATTPEDGLTANSSQSEGQNGSLDGSNSAKKAPDDRLPPSKYEQSRRHVVPTQDQLTRTSSTPGVAADPGNSHNNASQSLPASKLTDGVQLLQSPVGGSVWRIPNELQSVVLSGPLSTDDMRGTRQRKKLKNQRVLHGDEGIAEGLQSMTLGERPAMSQTQASPLHHISSSLKNAVNGKAVNSAELLDDVLQRDAEVGQEKESNRCTPDNNLSHLSPRLTQTTMP